MYIRKTNCRRASDKFSSRTSLGEIRHMLRSFNKKLDSPRFKNLAIVGTLLRDCVKVPIDTRISVCHASHA